MKYFLLSLLSAVLLSLPFFEHFSGVLLFIAFIPLLVVEADLSAKGKKGSWKWAALTFWAWNLITTFWIMHATPGGMVAAVTATAALETFVFWLFTLVKKRTNNTLGYIAFVAFWVTWEHFFLNAEISWPWLTLGNGFAKDIYLVQWYDVTGALGGSCWALLCNVAIFAVLRSTLLRKKGEETPPPFFRHRFEFLNTTLAKITAIALLIFVPIVYSIIRFCTYQPPQGETCRVAILQPNIDPFNEKFKGLSAQQQLNVLLQLAESVVDSSTHYVVAPETALPDLWENTFASSSAIRQVRNFCLRYPQISFITGASTLYQYAEDEELSHTARNFSNSDRYYDVYNTALQIDTGAEVGVYHKSKLVVAVEMLPYPKYLKFLRKWSIDLGGSSGGLGTQKERVVFTRQDQKFKAGVAVCYESIFGEYYTQYVQKGANIMFIITNDGWWRDTPGYKQHLSYARLRAIETRRSIVRSANTGISAIINQRGEIVARTQWWERTTLAGTVTANDALTVYVRRGDVVARIAQLITLIMLGCALVIPKKK